MFGLNKKGKGEFTMNPIEKESWLNYVKKYYLMILVIYVDVEI